MTKPTKKGQNPNPGGRPRNVRIGNAAGLVDLLAFAGEIKMVNRSSTAELTDKQQDFRSNLSRQARETGKLTRKDARLILAWQLNEDARKLDSFVREERRYRKRWAKENGPPFKTSPEPRTICTCAHRHCDGPCRLWAQPPAPCFRLISKREPWSLPVPCTPGTRTCQCRHVHCELCGIGASENDPLIQPAYSCRIVLDQLELERIWIGWRCPACMPEEFKSVPLPEPPARQLSFPGCPRCGGDVAIEGENYRCVGLDGESNRSRYAADLLFDQHVKLMKTTALAGPKEQRAFTKRMRELLRTLPEKFDALKPCGREGSVAYVVEQRWRQKLPASNK